VFAGPTPAGSEGHGVEEAAPGWFQELSYGVLPGPQLAPGEPAAQRESFGDVVLVGRLRGAIRQLNPAIPEDAREEAPRKMLRLTTPSPPTTAPRRPWATPSSR